MHGRPQHWDRVVDVVIVGTGGGAMVSATPRPTVAPTCSWSRRTPSSVVPPVCPAA